MTSCCPVSQCCIPCLNPCTPTSCNIGNTTPSTVVEPVFKEGTFTQTFTSGSWASPGSKEVTAAYSIIGNQVTLTYPDILAGGSGSATATIVSSLSTPIPSFLIPKTTKYFVIQGDAVTGVLSNFVRVIVNGTVNPISTTGTMEFNIGTYLQGAGDPTDPFPIHTGGPNGNIIASFNSTVTGPSSANNGVLSFSVTYNLSI